jgi:membrane associated rhomboid family serine protease
MPANLQSFGFPPFTRAVKQLVYVCVAVFVASFFLARYQPGFMERILETAALVPGAVIKGYPDMPIPHIWQLVTYGFIHDPGGVGHILFNMLSLWMFGATLEQGWGYRKFMEFYFFCIVGAALVTIAFSYAGLLGLTPVTMTFGASGGIYGLIVAFGIIYAEMRVFVFGIFPLKAKWLAIIWVGIALFGALSERGGVANIAHLGGAAFGYFYLRFMPRGGVPFVVSERYYGIRNWYHRRKRKQAQKKFEVYMGKMDRKQYFDEHGNYRDPDERKGNGDGGGKWVN